MRIALATCSNLPDWEVDDRPLHDAFAERGVEIARPVWDDPAIDWSAFDACLLRTTWDYQEKRQAFVAWAERAAASTRLFNPPSVVRWNTHKSYLRDLAERGVPTAPTCWLDAGTSADIATSCREHGWTRAFLKPAVGATARETLRFEATPEGLRDAQAHADRLLPDEDLLLQPYLARVETDGELSAIFIDGRLTHGVRKVPVPGDYRVQDDFGAHDEPTELDPADVELAERVVASIDDDLVYARVDFLRNDTGALCVTELELVEPSLFLRHGPHAAPALVEAVVRRVGSPVA